MHGEFAGELEAEALVEGDGVGVRGRDVEIGVEVDRAVVLDEVREQAGGVALSAVGGVGAEAAELAPGVDAHALAAHGDELAFVPDAEVAAHFAGADAEKAGEGDVGEGDHGGCVGAG